VRATKNEAGASTAKENQTDEQRTPFRPRGAKRINWVKNVEAARGEAVIRQGRRRLVHLVAVPPEKRAPILREYVRIASSGRQHFPLPIGAPLSDFQAIAGRYPVYRIEPA